MPRLVKQILIGGVYLVLFVVVGFGVYRLNNPTPTCTDGAKNQGEDGVDCGTVCGKLCAEAPLDLRVESIQIIPTRPNEYDVVAEIINPNDRYGATGISYILSLVNGANGAVATERGTLYVLPAQTRYLVHTAVVTEGEVVRGLISLGTPNWQAIDLRAPRIDFPLRREQYAVESASRASTFEGTIYNDSDFDFGKVDITVLLFGREGTIVGMNRTEVTTLPSRTERYFKMTWPFPIPDAVVRTQVQATTDIFKNDNFLRRYGTLEDFQRF